MPRRTQEAERYREALERIAKMDFDHRTGWGGCGGIEWQDMQPDFSYRRSAESPMDVAEEALRKADLAAEDDYFGDDPTRQPHDDDPLPGYLPPEMH